MERYNKWADSLTMSELRMQILENFRNLKDSRQQGYGKWPYPQLHSAALLKVIKFSYNERRLTQINKTLGRAAEDALMQKLAEGL